jgi:putative ABC transport system substrate-binding protein
MRVIGFLGTESSEGFAYLVTAFHQGLKEMGYVEGENVAIDYRWAEGHYERLPALVANLVQRPVAVIAVGGGPEPARAAVAATATIPIVFVTGGDPVKQGIVASLNRPQRNITGISLLTTGLDPKRLGLLHEAVPAAFAIAVLVNPTTLSAEAELIDVKAAAGTMGLQIHVLKASSEREIDAAFAGLSRLRVGALLVATERLFNSRRQQLVELAARNAIPSIYDNRETVAAGGLMSYGSSIADGYRQMGLYIGRILKRAKPADLPVLQPTKFELAINLKTAKTLGLTVPQSLLLRADEVIQ